jgi:hypothetical protein
MTQEPLSDRFMVSPYPLTTAMNFEDNCVGGFSMVTRNKFWSISLLLPSMIANTSSKKEGVNPSIPEKSRASSPLPSLIAVVKSLYRPSRAASNKDTFLHQVMYFEYFHFLKA